MPFSACRTFLFTCFAFIAIGSLHAQGTWAGYVSIDAATGNVILEDKPDVVSPPASMTKLMTFAVVTDQLKTGAISLDTMVDISPEDARMGGTQVFLDPREHFTIEELIHALMIQSANDAAHALARASAGSVDAFVELMNAKAKALGMTNSVFRTPHGLPPSSRKDADGDLTTPRDFAKLCMYLVRKTNVLDYAAVKERDFGPNRKNGPMHMINHNKLLGTVAGVDGLKTGYTRSAGYCLSTTAQRNGKRVIVVIMGAFGAGGKIDLGVARDRKATEILDKSFAALPANSPPFKAENPVFAVPQAVAPNAALVPAPVKPEAVPASAEPDAPAKTEEPATVKFVFPPK